MAQGRAGERRGGGRLGPVSAPFGARGRIGAQPRRQPRLPQEGSAEGATTGRRDVGCQGTRCTPGVHRNRRAFAGTDANWGLAVCARGGGQGAASPFGGQRPSNQALSQRSDRPALRRERGITLRSQSSCSPAQMSLRSAPCAAAVQALAPFFQPQPDIHRIASPRAVFSHLRSPTVRTLRLWCAQHRDRSSGGARRTSQRAPRALQHAPAAGPPTPSTLGRLFQLAPRLRLPLGPRRPRRPPFPAAPPPAASTNTASRPALTRSPPFPFSPFLQRGVLCVVALPTSNPNFSSPGHVPSTPPSSPLALALTEGDRLSPLVSSLSPPPFLPPPRFLPLLAPRPPAGCRACFRGGTASWARRRTAAAHSPRSLPVLPSRGDSRWSNPVRDHPPLRRFGEAAVGRGGAARRLRHWPRHAGLVPTRR